MFKNTLILLKNANYTWYNILYSLNFKISSYFSEKALVSGNNYDTNIKAVLREL